MMILSLLDVNPASNLCPFAINVLECFAPVAITPRVWKVTPTVINDPFQQVNKLSSDSIILMLKFWIKVGGANMYST